MEEGKGSGKSGIGSVCVCVLLFGFPSSNFFPQRERDVLIHNFYDSETHSL